MNHHEHQRERMRFWARIYGSSFLDGNLPERCSDFADTAVAEFDKRFPAPAAVEPEPRITIEWPACGDAELAALREKARYWDAMWPVWYGQEDDAIHAARKVIDAGALK